MFGWTAAEAVGRQSPDHPRRAAAEEDDIIARIRWVNRSITWKRCGAQKTSGLNVSVTISRSRARADGSSARRSCARHQRAPASRRLARSLAAIIDSADDAIVSKNLDGVIQSWNRGAERMFGWTAAEAVGRHITLIIPEERRAEEDDIIARIRRGELVDHLETVRVAKNGRRLGVSVTISPVKDASGRVVGASKVARDITERRRLEDERARLLVEAKRRIAQRIICWPCIARASYAA